MLRGTREGKTVPWDSFDPPEDGGRPVADALVSYPGEGERSCGRVRTSCCSRRRPRRGRGAHADRDDGRARIPGPPLHIHSRLRDSFYVVEGTLGLRSARHLAVSRERSRRSRRDAAHVLQPGRRGGSRVNVWPRRASRPTSRRCGLRELPAPAARDGDRSRYDIESSSRWESRHEAARSRHVSCNTCADFR